MGWTRKQIRITVEAITTDQLKSRRFKFSRFLSFKDMGADSLDEVELIMSLEAEFGIEIPDEDAELMKTPRGVELWLTAKLR